MFQVMATHQIVSFAKVRMHHNIAPSAELWDEDALEEL
jgi:hypothetical protein